ncbi:MAG TPA: hypothetical protein VF774_01705 [Pseudoduganella sp.]
MQPGSIAAITDVSSTPSSALDGMGLRQGGCQQAALLRGELAT